MTDWVEEFTPPPRSRPAPMARASCAGANRQVEVTRWPKADKVACTHCSLKLVGDRKVFPNDKHPTTGKQRLYLILPNHIGVGQKQPDKIDWGAL